MRRLWIGGSILVVAAAALGAAALWLLLPKSEPAQRPPSTPTPSATSTPPQGPASQPTSELTPELSQLNNSCIQCHKSIPKETLAGHSVSDWLNSPHAKQRITCEACHGGDPTQREANAAHAGILSSRDPQSRIYFKKIPQTCGRCHAEEFERFQASLHFAQLEKTGLGPNCVTCHGAMAISILNPDSMQRTCSACHNERMVQRLEEPLKARMLLILMSQTQAYLTLAESWAVRQKADGVNTVKAEELLAQARAESSSARQQWHTFKVTLVEDHVRRAFSLAQAAVLSLKPK